VEHFLPGVDNISVKLAEGTTGLTNFGGLVLSCLPPLSRGNSGINALLSGIIQRALGIY
jgi:hypothetical protein